MKTKHNKITAEERYKLQTRNKWKTNFYNKRANVYAATIVILNSTAKKNSIKYNKQVFQYNRVQRLPLRLKWYSPPPLPSPPIYNFNEFHCYI